jgi:SAM-dependent methyltransferase
MARRVEPEWLDSLPPEDARARRSRRDLVRVNALMANAGIVGGALSRRLRKGDGLRLVELGAGDGRFAARVLRRLEGRTGEIVLVDRAPCVAQDAVEAMQRAGWKVRSERADAIEFLDDATARCDAIVANLFLHHLEEAHLRQLLHRAARRAPLFVACEPRRSAVALAGSHLLGLIGCNDVTRHDAVASVRAGFSGRELTTLWPAGEAWRMEEAARGLFSHAFVASRS